MDTNITGTKLTSSYNDRIIIYNTSNFYNDNIKMGKLKIGRGRLIEIRIAIVDISYYMMKIGLRV